MAWPRMFDKSTPPLAVPAGFQAVGGYLGGHTPHVWTPAEWARFGKLRKLPIYVPGVAIGTPGLAEAEAFDALQRLYHLRVPKRTPVVWDMETAVAPAQLVLVHDIMAWAGYRLWVYGSASTVFGNPPCDGYWVADYAGKGPFMYPHADVRATQYAAPGHGSGGPWDESTVKAWQYRFVLKTW